MQGSRGYPLCLSRPVLDFIGREAEAILVRRGPESADFFKKCIEIEGEFPGCLALFAIAKITRTTSLRQRWRVILAQGGAKGLSVEEFDRRVGIGEGRANDQGRLKRGWM